MGDSHTYDLYHAVACLMLDLWDYTFEGALPIDGENAAFEAMAEHVVHSKPPECLPLVGGTKICHFRANHGQVRDCTLNVPRLLTARASASASRESNQACSFGVNHWQLQDP